jgi:hypothetical protein
MRRLSKRTDTVTPLELKLEVLGVMREDLDIIIRTLEVDL